MKNPYDKDVIQETNANYAYNQAIDDAIVILELSVNKNDHKAEWLYYFMKLIIENIESLKKEI